MDLDIVRRRKKDDMLAVDCFLELIKIIIKFRGLLFFLSEAGESGLISLELQ